MRAILSAVLVLWLVNLVRSRFASSRKSVEIILQPESGEVECYGCVAGDFPTDNTTSWEYQPKDAYGNAFLLGQLAMPKGSNDSVSFSEAICCRYFFNTVELATIQKGALQDVTIRLNRWAFYNNNEKPQGVFDYAYGFGIYNNAGGELTSAYWSGSDSATARPLGIDSSDSYEGFFPKEKVNQTVFDTTNYIVIGYQIINSGQDAVVKYAIASLTLNFEVGNGSAIGFGVGFGLGLPVIFLAVFLPVYICVVKPKMQKKTEAKTMEMGKSSQKTATNTQYGAISGTTSSTSTGSDNLLGSGNYSPLGPTASVAVSSPAKSAGSGNMKDRFDISYREIEFKREIGAGGFGKVFMGEWQSTEVAIKVSNNMTSNEEFRKEAELMVNIRPHPNVLQVLGVSTDGVAPAIIMEYCPGGSLDLLMFDKSKPVTAEYQFRLILGIARGMLHLHKNNIVHRDLAARNILLSRDGEPKISDFGMSRMIESSIKEGTTRTNVGPIRWMAPESIKSKVYSTKSDVWSFGVVISEILNREEPHKEIEDVIEVAIAIRNELKTPKIATDAPDLLKDIMKQCWAINPDDRPEMDSLCDKLIKYKDQNNL